MNQPLAAPVGRRRPAASFASILLYAVSSLAGIAAFVAPLLGVAAESQAALPLMTSLLVGVCLLALLMDAQAAVVSTKTVALLGVLIAVTSGLRVLETAIPGPGGFSPIFAPIILVGAVFGVRLGFLMGALTLFASALLTGGVGPWLPYQMFAAGWIGAGAGLLPGRRVSLLGVYGFVSGFGYGLLLNLTAWPYLMTMPAAGATLGAGLRQYALFYLSTSLVWDFFRSSGTLLFLVVLGESTQRILERFQRRMRFQWLPLPEPVPGD